MQSQTGKSDLSCGTPWWALIRKRLTAAILSYWPDLRQRSYRAERYYMRGPGPKWREKHGRSAH
jgi:hypothetical protein